jgi:hypothetical protein
VNENDIKHWYQNAELILNINISSPISQQSPSYFHYFLGTPRNPDKNLRAYNGEYKQ